MRVIISIQVMQTITDEEYNELFPTEEALDADIELFKQETIEDIEEVFPGAEGIAVAVTIEKE